MVQLSVLIVAHNVESFIERCLRSVAAQEFARELQIVVVDDGSCDDTLAIVGAFRRSHPHLMFAVAAQSNAGVSAARNLALRMAEGRYLAFLDGDDEWSENFTTVLAPHIRRGECDIIEFNAVIIDEDGRRIGTIGNCQNTKQEGVVASNATLLRAAKNGQFHLWSRVYKSSLFNDVFFPVGRTYEDAAVVPSIYLNSNSIYRIGSELYRYRRRQGSITAYKSLQSFKDMSRNVEEALGRCAAPDEGDRRFWRAVTRNLVGHAASELLRAELGVYREARNLFADMLISAQSSTYRRRGPTFWAWQARIRLQRALRASLPRFVPGLVRRLRSMHWRQTG
jgi:glycosyltransferase involved in cell wall biosynthesis